MSDDTPRCAGKTPSVIELEPGTYHWCACGESNAQPFCDGAHSTTCHVPLAFEITEKKKVALCTCKMTARPPFCDGAHKNLPQDK